jgi:hypothetical protein
MGNRPAKSLQHIAKMRGPNSVRVLFDAHFCVSLVRAGRTLGKSVKRRYPARHYIMVDDKLRILAAMKRIWQDQLTTIFPRQGHYACDPKIVAAYPAPDITVDCIGVLVDYDLQALIEGTGIVIAVR